MISMIGDYLDTIEDLDKLASVTGINNLNRQKRKIYLKEKYMKDDILLDAVSAGLDLPFVYSSVKEVNEEDIKDISIYFPESNYSLDGMMRCRNEIFPAGLACHNHRISIETRKFLLERCSLREYLLNRTKISLLNDLILCYGENGSLTKDYVSIEKELSCF